MKTQEAEIYDIDVPDIVLPGQDGARFVNHLGMRRLMAALLLDAVDLANGRGTHESGHTPMNIRRKDARRWIESDDQSALFSFLRVCEALDLDPAMIRRRLKLGLYRPAWIHR